jgi:hypothetical protein
MTWPGAASIGGRACLRERLKAAMNGPSVEDLRRGPLICSLGTALASRTLLSTRRDTVSQMSRMLLMTG